MMNCQDATGVHRIWASIRDIGYEQKSGRYWLSLSNHYIIRKWTGRQTLTENSKAADQQTQLRYTTDV